MKHLAKIPVSPVDLYGTLLGGRLLFESDDPKATPVDPRNFRLSHQRRFLKDGQHPMPIYTAVRHEMLWKDKAKGDIDSIAEQLKGQIDTVDWWNWMEFTPYEVGCEELEGNLSFLPLLKPALECYGNPNKCIKLEVSHHYSILM